MDGDVRIDDICFKDEVSKDYEAGRCWWWCLWNRMVKIVRAHTTSKNPSERRLIEEPGRLKLSMKEVKGSQFHHS